MGLFRRDEPALATVLGRPQACLVCGGTLFWTREVKLNTTGMELLNLAWANQSATGLVCAACGYVAEFLADTVELWESEAGYPPAGP